MTPLVVLSMIAATISLAAGNTEYAIFFMLQAIALILENIYKTLKEK